MQIVSPFINNPFSISRKTPIAHYHKTDFMFKKLKIFYIKNMPPIYIGVWSFKYEYEVPVINIFQKLKLNMHTIKHALY